jgi:hypothetical protein
MTESIREQAERAVAGSPLIEGLKENESYQHDPEQESPLSLMERIDLALAGHDDGYKEPSYKGTSSRSLPIYVSAQIEEPWDNGYMDYLDRAVHLTQLVIEEEERLRNGDRITGTTTVVIDES